MIDCVCFVLLLSGGFVSWSKIKTKMHGLGYMVIFIKCDVEPIGYFYIQKRGMGWGIRHRWS